MSFTKFRGFTPSLKPTYKANGAKNIKDIKAALKSLYIYSKAIYSKDFIENILVDENDTCQEIVTLLNLLIPTTIIYDDDNECLSSIIELDVPIFHACTLRLQDFYKYIDEPKKGLLMVNLLRMIDSFADIYKGRYTGTYGDPMFLDMIEDDLAVAKREKNGNLIQELEETIDYSNYIVNSINDVHQKICQKDLVLSRTKILNLAKKFPEWLEFTKDVLHIYKTYSYDVVELNFYIEEFNEYDDYSLSMNELVRFSWDDDNPIDSEIQDQMTASENEGGVMPGQCLVKLNKSGNKEVDKKTEFLKAVRELFDVEKYECFK